MTPMFGEIGLIAVEIVWRSIGRMAVASVALVRPLGALTAGPPSSEPRPKAEVARGINWALGGSRLAAAGGMSRTSGSSARRCSSSTAWAPRWGWRTRRAWRRNTRGATNKASSIRRTMCITLDGADFGPRQDARLIMAVPGLALSSWARLRRSLARTQPNLSVDVRKSSCCVMPPDPICSQPHWSTGTTWCGGAARPGP